VRLLLDTHVVLWAIKTPDRLLDRAMAAIRSADNEVLVSAATVWEVAIKRQLGKLDFQGPFVAALDDTRMPTLAISAEHADAAGSLPLHHRDPFDRMLIAQAMLEGLSIVTRDPAFEPYGVPLLAA
jgi:PIN domain nuclease of toxin-antitoxin system